MTMGQRITVGAGLTLRAGRFHLTKRMQGRQHYKQNRPAPTTRSNPVTVCQKSSVHSNPFLRGGLTDCAIPMGFPFGKETITNTSSEMNVKWTVSIVTLNPIHPCG